MFAHKCQIDQMKVVGARPNPLDPKWSEWTLVICSKCKKLYEWQHHSEEQMHGSDLEITAIPTDDYIHHCYGINRQQLEEIIAGRRKIRRFNRYSEAYVEEPF